MTLSFARLGPSSSNAHNSVKSLLKYCAVFYEGQHNDARTNLAIAMTAAEKGADIANYGT